MINPIIEMFITEDNKEDNVNKQNNNQQQENKDIEKNNTEKQNNQQAEIKDQEQILKNKENEKNQNNKDNNELNKNNEDKNNDNNVNNNKTDNENKDNKQDEINNKENKFERILIFNTNIPETKRIHKVTKELVFDSIYKQLNKISQDYNNKKNIKLTIYTAINNEIEDIATADVELNLPDNFKDIQELKIEIVGKDLEGVATGINTNAFKKLIEQTNDGHIIIKNEDLDRKGKLANKLGGLLIVIAIILLLFAMAISILHHAGAIGGTGKEVINQIHTHAQTLKTGIVGYDTKDTQVTFLNHGAHAQAQAAAAKPATTSTQINNPSNHSSIQHNVDHYALYGLAVAVITAFLVKLFRVKHNVNTKQEETMIKEYLKNYDLMLEFMQFKNEYVNKQYTIEFDSSSISNVYNEIKDFIIVNFNGSLKNFDIFYNSVSVHLFQNAISSISAFLGVILIGLAITAFAVTIISPISGNSATYLKGVLLTAIVGVVMLFALYNLVTGHSMSNFNPPELFKSLKQFIQTNAHSIFSDTGLSIIYGLMGATIVALIYTLLKNAENASVKDVRQIPTN